MDKLMKSDIDNIRNSVDIVDIIGEYVPLVKEGKNYKGFCPFHNDVNHPSFSVSREKQIYKCFSCPATGNVFTFLMEKESISFKEALKIVADKAGITLNIGYVKEQVNPFSKMYEAYDIAFKFYRNNINTKEGIEAKEYLKKRNIDEDIIKEFGIGLSLSNRQILSDLLIKKGYNIDMLVKGGLSFLGDNGYYDMYYKRIMFPLWDTFGKVVGFSGRIYNGDSASKYINTSETPIFKKGELLYNYHRAKEEAKKSKTIIIVEGFMDVIRCYAAGIKNVVASMGTAVTREQAMLLKRLAPNVILMFDGDKAGEKATFACSDELSKIGIDALVVRLEENLDPDEYILKYGSERIKAKLDNPMSIMDFKLSHYRENVNLENSTQKAEYVQTMLNELSRIKDPIIREITLQKLSIDSKLDKTFLEKQLKDIDSKNNVKVSKEPPKKEVKYSKYDMAQRALIYYMLKSKEVLKIYNNKMPYMPDEKYRLLAREIVSYYKINGIINTADLITELSQYNKELVSLVGEIATSPFKDDYSLDEIDDYIRVINEYNIKVQKKEILEQMKKESDPMKKVQMAQKIVELKMRGDCKDDK